MLIVPATPQRHPAAVGLRHGGRGAAAGGDARRARGGRDRRGSSLVRRLALAPPALAQLLASIAASEASHALLLRTDGATG